jgi:hypothetical protein
LFSVLLIGLYVILTTFTVEWKAIFSSDIFFEHVKLHKCMLNQRHLGYRLFQIHSHQLIHLVFVKTTFSNAINGHNKQYFPLNSRNIMESFHLFILVLLNELWNFVLKPFLMNGRKNPY